MKACFIGLGYIGLPTAIIASSNGIDSVGVDINPDIVDMINAAKLQVAEPGLGFLLRESVAAGRFRAVTEAEPCDAYFLTVPTPFKGKFEPDTSCVEDATRAIIPLLKENDLFVIESTSPVGTTERMAEMIFAERPELKGKVFVAYCPERLLPGNVIYEIVHNDRVIGGIDEASTEKACEFYSRFVKGELLRTTPRMAEMCKLAENSSRDVQIAYANELSVICDLAGINVWELIDLANRHPRVNILRPGCGVGGRYLSVDPYFITSAFPKEAKVISLARETNNFKAEWCAAKVINAILRFESKNKRKPLVAMMGMTFKPDIDDMRDSPAMRVITEVMTDQPDTPILVAEPNIENHPMLKLTDYEQAYESADIVVMLMSHKPFYSLTWRDDKEILDFCGVFKR